MIFAESLLTITYTERLKKTIGKKSHYSSFPIALFLSNADFLCKLLKISFKGGAGGNRTRVQTRKPYAFYTLIPAFDFRATARPGPPTGALSPKISSSIRGYERLFPICLRRLVLGFGTTPLERRPVQPPCDRIEP